MTKTDSAPTPTETPIPPELLIHMHQAATHMLDSDDKLVYQWGLHLLEDWRSLELLAEKYR